MKGTIFLLRIYLKLVLFLAVACNVQPSFGINSSHEVGRGINSQMDSPHGRDWISHHFRLEN